ncbi:membrane metallopeptidase [Haloferax mucosum ATCC BAA-1512]|uniref:Membrane metallopeptidase n=1 Tax=Haloferax mucosum ATCC BAA-1512 TaxID=662479 RepID=M0IQ58_9EURY|nr:membrane metallopeptidase [Haloferax mucosum]ELZ98865.1 membrane metallopeptidase [Haloferax mucosum ATCC BAA-1512]
MNVTFSSRELRDLVVAWLALGLAFAIFFAGGGNRALALLLNGSFGLALIVSLLTAGVGFLLHEVAHKVVAIRFDQIAEFRADYGMLGIAVMSALIGFIFAAPGAVYHRGMLTEREHGLIALAGPVTNLLLLVAFAPVYVVGLLGGSEVVQLVGARGLVINAFLAAFNMLPFGSLDGRTVKAWSTPVFGGVLGVSVVLTVALLLFVGI